jgi:hypothetical protein
MSITKVNGKGPRAQAGQARNTRHLLASMQTDAILSEAARRRRAMQTTPPTPEKLRACPHCEELYGARRLRKHAPVCRREQLISDHRKQGQSKGMFSPESAADLVLKQCRLNHPPLLFANPRLRSELVRLALLGEPAGEDLEFWVDRLVADCAEHQAAIPRPKFVWAPKGSR